MTEPWPPLCLGVLGCGRVFQRFHRPAIARVPTVTLAAACDTDPARLAWALPGAPCPTFYDSPAKLIGHPGLEALLVLTPPIDHAEAVVQAMGQGLHVLVEKPMALDPTAAREMVRAARQAKRRLQVGFSRRFREPYRRVRDLLRRDPREIGAVRFELAFPTASWKAETDFLGDETRGGGVLDDVLSHQVDLLCWMLGSAPVQVSAVVDSSRGSAVRADFKIGTLTAHCEAAHARYQERLEIEMIDGTVLEASGSRMRRTLARFSGWRRRRAFLQDRFALLRDRLFRRPNVSLMSFERQLRDFEWAVRGRRSDGASAEDGLLAVNLVQACRASARQGGVWLPVESGTRSAG